MNIPTDEKPKIPSFIQNGKPLIRGGAAWIDRERAREKAGCKVICLYELAPAWSWVGTKPRNREK